MSAFGPPACDGVEKLLSGPDEVSGVDPLDAPGSPCGPAGPAGPGGPCWFQTRSVSVPAVHVTPPSALMTRTAPVAVLTQAWIVPSADGIAATPTAAPAPSAAMVGSAMRRKRREVGAICRH